MLFRSPDSEVFDQTRIEGSFGSKSGSSIKLDIELSYAEGRRVRTGKITNGTFEVSWDLFERYVKIQENGKIELERFDYIGDDLIERELQDLLGRTSFDKELERRLERAMEIVRISGRLSES